MEWSRKTKSVIKKGRQVEWRNEVFAFVFGFQPLKYNPRDPMTTAESFRRKLHRKHKLGAHLPALPSLQLISNTKDLWSNLLQRSFLYAELINEGRRRSIQLTG
jgi:hypothetical protein